ncbi:MAG: S-layer homology domain-containing protein [Defluviitaleaceae bacterium]|nr:S-layer homology domain-containing protein [Defluviitaleaceae bacterium]
MKKNIKIFVAILFLFVLAQTQNIFAEPVLMISDQKITVNDTNLEKTVTFAWAGITGGQIIISENNLPSAVQLVWNADRRGINVIGRRPHHSATEPVKGEFKVVFSLMGTTAELTVDVELSPLDPPDPFFQAVSHISFLTTAWRVGEDFDFKELAAVSPSRGDGGFPTIDDMLYEIVSVNSSVGEIFADFDSYRKHILRVTGEGQGTVRVRMTIPKGRSEQDNFSQEISITFSSQEITARHEGLDNLFSGVEVDGRIIFELKHGSGIFAKEIFPQDFFVRGLPWGLRAEPAERINDNTVTIKIVGTPIFRDVEKWTLSVPTLIPTRNLWQAYVPAAVLLSSKEGFEIYSAIASANISPNNLTFDLNRNGWSHRNFTFYLNDRDGEFSFTNIKYGLVTLREGTDFLRGEFNPNSFTITREFFSRLPVGQWELTVTMSRGENPKISMNIIDSSVTVQSPPFFVPAPLPAPPSAPPTPDESFIYLTGGKSVSTSSLRWDLDRARVSPEVHDGVAQVTIRSHVLDHLSWIAPGQSFEIITPAARVKIPNDFLNIIVGGRAAIADRGLRYNQVDVRIGVIDRSNDARYKNMFGAVYSNGEILSPVVEFIVEFIHDEKIFFTAQEFSRPINLIFSVMNNAAHLRPAAFAFKRAWLEFVPYSASSPNEITMSTIFPGVVSVMHNRVRFEDVYSTHWGFVQSYAAAYSGIVAPSEELSPDTPITRGEFAQLLAFALQLPRADAEISGFADVLPPNIFFDGVSRLFAAGLLGAHQPNARFYPNAIITREEIASILGMAINLGKLGAPVRQAHDRPISLAFTDAALFSNSHFANVQTTINYGVMVGYPDSSFRPRNNGTRIYALQSVMNLAQLFGIVD